jgi:hypothetical protein
METTLLWDPILVSDLLIQRQTSLQLRCTIVDTS